MDFHETILLAVSHRTMESAGLVKGYRALIDWNQVFKSQRLLVEITLARHTAPDMRRFEQRMSAADEVEFCYATGAAWITLQ